MKIEGKHEKKEDKEKLSKRGIILKEELQFLFLPGERDGKVDIYEWFKWR